MACSSCEERRKMIQEAASSGGVAGLLRITPVVMKHVLQKPPVIRAKRPLPKPPIQRED